MSTWAIPSHAEWAVPGYTEVGLVGHGVSGRVVAAVSKATGQRVAIKYLDENVVGHSGFLAEFRSGAERLMSLNAPHVAHVFDYAERPGAGAAIVTELVDGVSLRRMISSRRPLSVKAALVVFKDSLLGLAAAHSRHVAHRDVKPDNVLVDAGGWCTLTDFGLAVQADKQVPVRGTPEYLAPELWNGAPNVPASDIYAATIMLCESLTGSPPFTGRPARVREQHENLSAPLEEYDPPLHDLIGSGLAKDPDRRPRSALAFAREVDARAADAYGPAWEAEGRRELAVRAREVLPSRLGAGDSAAVTRRARRKLVVLGSVAALIVVAAAGTGAVLLPKKSGVQLQSVSKVSAEQLSTQISPTNPVVAAKCTTPTTFTFTGTITYLQPGEVSYQWVYSSGRADPVQTLNFVQPGALTVTDGSVATSTAGNGWAQLKVLLNPGAKVSNRAAYSLLCSTANSDISLSVHMTPAAQSYASCSVPRPAVTALGNITSKNAGVVTYYWVRSDGTRTKPAQLTFNGPGTLAAKSLMFLAPVPSSGNVELVVTKPAVATSTPAAYKVTCAGGAAQPGATAPAGPTAKATPTAKASPSVSKSASPTASKSASPSPGPTTPSPAPTTPSPPPPSATASATLPLGL